MLVQWWPERSRCCHWYLKLVGLFVHVPWCSVSVWPCWAVPLIVGGEVLVGTGGTTTAVAAEVAGAPGPVALLAVSCTLIVWPTSPGAGVYVCAVAPEIAAQLLPAVSHCCHW